MSVIADIGALYAGGAGRRFGGVDKGALMLGDQTLGARATAFLAARSRRQVILSSVRRDWMTDADAVLLDDTMGPDGSSLGPIGALISALQWAQAEAGGDALVLTAPIDAPFPPSDLLDQLAESLGEAPGVIAAADDRPQAVFALWRASACKLVRDQAFTIGERALHRVAAGVGASTCEIRARAGAFFNINTEQDLDDARALAASAS